MTCDSYIVPFTAVSRSMWSSVDRVLYRARHRPNFQPARGPPKERCGFPGQSTMRSNRGCLPCPTLRRQRLPPLWVMGCIPVAGSTLSSSLERHSGERVPGLRSAQRSVVWKGRTTGMGYALVTQGSESNRNMRYRNIFAPFSALRPTPKWWSTFDEYLPLSTG